MISLIYSSEERVLFEKWFSANIKIYLDIITWTMAGV